jgi:hypothetical protein
VPRRQRGAEAGQCCERDEVMKAVAHRMVVLVKVNATDAGDEVGDVGGRGFGDERGGGKLSFNRQVRDGEEGVLGGCHRVDLGDAEEDERGGGRLSFNHRVGDGEEGVLIGRHRMDLGDAEEDKETEEGEESARREGGQGDGAQGGDDARLEGGIERRADARLAGGREQSGCGPSSTPFHERCGG